MCVVLQVGFVYKVWCILHLVEPCQLCCLEWHVESGQLSSLEWAQGKRSHDQCYAETLHWQEQTEQFFCVSVVLVQNISGAERRDMGGFFSRFRIL